MFALCEKQTRRNQMVMSALWDEWVKGLE